MCTNSQELRTHLGILTGDGPEEKVNQIVRPSMEAPLHTPHHTAHKLYAASQAERRARLEVGLNGGIEAEIDERLVPSGIAVVQDIFDRDVPAPAC